MAEPVASAAPTRRRETSLQNRLFYSFVSIGVLAALCLAVSLLGVLWLRSLSDDLATRTAPTTYAAERLQSAEFHAT